jgi:hypothetical protein
VGVCECFLLHGAYRLRPLLRAMAFFISSQNSSV